MTNAVSSSAPLVVITGASSGIGQALALHFARAGWRLALMVRKEKETKKWLDACNIRGECYRIYIADVADTGATLAAGQAVLVQQGVPDVVIANAGNSVGMDTADAADIDVMARTFSTNNVGMAATFQPFVTPMVARGSGTLVGVASVAAIRGLPGHGAYCASKAAVVSYLESLRGELRASGVKVVTLLPGYIDTPLTQRNRYPMPFLMQPQDFARQAAQAIKQQSSYAVIPWQMGVVAKLLRLLPNVLFDRIFAGRPRKHRQHE
ncbi:MAG TPA: SDR family oxidoreductase [Burkholderiaceae bacterium]|nr:SDR family oxidoreductase [Burkholderiaceae bacterium]